ncbi:MAG: radical SAM protein [Bdellovibrionales bacterium]|nr:radical SAM protein [Bdellovibrionales bacterium]
MDQTVTDYNATRFSEDRGTLCHAPSVNLNFEQTGNATACCYNRRFILGRYPAQTVSEIWEGARIHQMRELLAKGDLSQGCQLCMQQLQARNYSGLRARPFDGMNRNPKAKHSDGPVPRMMEFELSNVCNLECVMCNGYFSSSIRKNRERLEPQKNVYDEAFVEQLVPYLPYLLQTKFLGGEPFLNPIYYKIWEKIVEVNPSIDACITTNATIMNKKVKDLIFKLKPSFIISCDSLDKKTYESIRVNASFDAFIENLGVFMKASSYAGKFMAFSVCPMVNNWKTLPQILQFANENTICLGINTVVWPPQLSIKNLEPGEILKIIVYLESQFAPDLARHSNWWVRNNFHTYQDMLKQFRYWAAEKVGRPAEAVTHA